MLKNRKGSRRAFTVETKGGGRDRTIIPSRAAEIEPSQPSAAWPAVTPAKPRRILPNLIEPVEVEAPEPRRRGRPRKVPSVAAEPVAAPVAPATPLSAPKPSTAPPSTVKRAARRWTALPAGEQWKRRLPRWSR